MTDPFGLVALGVFILLLGATDLPERLHRSSILLGIADFLERISRANGLRGGNGPVLIVCAVAGALVGRFAWTYSIQVALVAAIAAAVAPVVVLWLRTAAHERGIEREAIAFARQLAAHLAAGENLYASIRQLEGDRSGPVQEALGFAADEFRLDRPLTAALAAGAGRVRHPSLSLLLTVLAQVAQQGVQGQAAADVLDLVARQMEQVLRAREQLAERTRGVAIQIYVVAGAIPVMAIWLWQTSPYRFSVFELPLGRTVLLPFALAMELLGLALLWRWTRPGSL